MKRKLAALCSVVIALSIFTAVFTTGKGTENNLTTATIKTFYAENEEEVESTASTTGSLGDFLGGIDSDSIGDMLGGIGSGPIGIFGDLIGGVGDSLGNIDLGSALEGLGSGLSDLFGGLLGGFGESGTAAPVVSTTSADIGLIIPVPAATQTVSQTEEILATTESSGSGETVDYATTSNPYTKPTATFVAGDEDETIKWLQWIFIYTHYGLKDDGITGVLDEDTVAVVKKLQHENNFTVDGNITEDVINAAEVLYYQTILGDDVSAIEVPSENTTGEAVSNQATDSGEGNGIPVALLIIVLVITWVLAIGAIVIMFIFKKKQLSAKKEAENSDVSNAGSNQPEKENNKTEISSMADLFEDAEKNSK